MPNRHFFKEPSPPKLTLEDVVARIQAYAPQADVSLLRKAYAFSEKAHAGQLRRTGEPFLQHPLEVAGILTELKLDLPSVVAGLLHDVVEDTHHTKEELKREFGDDISNIVDGVTKIGKIEFKSVQEKQAENFRKMIVSMAEDIRVLLIKLADRLHNMRTLEALSQEKRERIARETLDIYAPLANRLGIGWIKAELEDLCLKYLKPDIYLSLVEKVAAGREEREKYIQSVVEIVQRALIENKFSEKVTGRYKHLFGIYHKMEKRGIPFEDVYDVMGIRIITDSKMNCYAILGLIHSLWRPVPGRFKDYIAIPKSNLYQSLHTTVVGPEGRHVEFQIRTDEMHRVAEEGIASHWTYKEGGALHPKDERTFAWLRQLVEWQQELADTRPFMDSVKTDLFTDVVYIFSPKGDVKELVKGATPIDFAYAIHTEIGNHCVGAKVNGKIVPLRYPLKNGDTVEILTSPTQVPSRDWLKIVKTSRAKAKVRHIIQLEERARSLDLGKKILEREIRKENLSSTEALKMDQMLLPFKEQGIHTLDDLYMAIGYGKVSAHQVIRPFLPEPKLREEIKQKVAKKEGLGKSEVKVSGLDDILIHLSKCCNPVPGDPIIGFITRGRGLSIHTVDCPNIDELDYDRDRLVEVDWEKQIQSTRPVDVSVLTLDRPGLLASVSASISETGANIRQAEITTSDDKKATLHFVVDIIDLKHLEKVLRNIEKVDGVLQARRIRRG
ncbi:MAG: bifunctional (p)ppGpp synthetase/guanosine-3',5'-bis(diphosphate) 3'-pyrophosphohydrolase [Candidatus Manganitrophaceae bacterium]